MDVTFDASGDTATQVAYTATLVSQGQHFEIPVTTCVLLRLHFAVILSIHFFLDKPRTILTLYSNLVETNLLQPLDAVACNIKSSFDFTKITVLTSVNGIA